MASVRFHRNSLGCVGCTIGLSPHIGVTAYSVGDNAAADALQKATSLASQLQQLTKDHPELVSVASSIPFVGTALAVLSHASGIIKAGGTVVDVAEKVGPAAANAIQKLFKDIF